MIALVTILDEETGTVLEKDKVIKPIRVDHYPDIGSSRYNFIFSRVIPSLFTQEIEHIDSIIMEGKDEQKQNN